MSWFKFKCNHPFDKLVVDKEHTVESLDFDFVTVNYHLLCCDCGEKLTIKYADMIGGVPEFLARGKSDLVNQHGGKQ